MDKQTKPKWTVKQKRVLYLFGVDFGQTLSDDGEFNDEYMLGPYSASECNKSVILKIP